ncbi:PH domain-containing protein [Candidatus Poseidonia alphae]|nr:PH domain-containing protein [Candidatus Poseidonia alphae]
MSADSPAPETDQKTEATTLESSEDARIEALNKKYRLISGESVLENGEARPSTLAFLGMYLIGLLVFGVHLLFTNPPEASGDASFSLKLLSTILELSSGEDLPIGFVVVMGGITWINRMLNVSTSGRWTTMALLVITLAPVIVQIDQLVATIANIFLAENMEPFIPIDYSYFWFGIVFTLGFWGATWFYQRSFSYAVTSNAVIFQHSFMLSRSHRRILFDRISEVMVERTPMGTLLGYATVTIMTDSGIGLVDESVGISAGTSGGGSSENSGDSTASKVRKGFFKSFFAFLSYQRTSRRVDPDPKHCFYKIRKWENVKLMLNEMHKKHSSSNLLEDLKTAISKEDA